MRGRRFPRLGCLRPRGGEQRDRSKAYFRRILSEIMAGTPLHHLIYISATAHPAALLAAVDMGAVAHCWLPNTKEHSIAHGKQLLHDSFLAQHLKAERESRQHEKRVYPTDMSVVHVSAPALQPVLFHGVSPDATLSSWRAGLDTLPATSFLETAVPTLVNQDLEENKLMLQSLSSVCRGPSQLRMALCARTGRREGDVVFVVKCLLFSTAGCCADFLNTGGNAALLDGPTIEVEGLLHGSEAKTQTSVFAVPVGAATLLRDHRGIRHYPNVAIEVHPEVGPNDGFLVCRVHTHNGCGITGGSELLADFGERYVPGSSQGHGASAKRFRGALDALFAKQASSYAEPSPEAADGDAAVVGGQPQPQPEPINLDPHLPQPPVDPAHWWEVCAHEGKLVVKARDSALGSKKIPPKTILFEFKGGKVDEVLGRAAQDHDVPFLFPKPRTTCVVDGGQVKLLSDVIRDQRCEAIYMHAKFPKGAMPAVFAPKKTAYYIPDGSSAALFVLATKATKLGELLWIVDSSACKVKPLGLALIAKKQLVVKTGESLEL